MTKLKMVQEFLVRVGEGEIFRKEGYCKREGNIARKLND